MNPNDPLLPDPLGTPEAMPPAAGTVCARAALQRSILKRRMLRPWRPK